MRLSVMAAFLALLLAATFGNAQMRGGFGGRGPAGSGGFRGPAFRGGFSGSTSFRGRRGFIGTFGGHRFSGFCSAFGPCFRSPFFGHRFHDRDDRFFFGGVPFYGAYAWPYYGYSSYDDSDNASQNQQYAAQQQQLLDDLQQERRRADELSDQLNDMRTPAPRPSAQSRTATVERPTPPTTLVFRDKRTTEIQNYVIAGNYLYQADPGSTHKIALADLDIPATVQANAKRGVEFDVPR